MTRSALPDWADSYLNFLGLSVKPPTYDFLAEFCQAHLCRLAFENVSKLIYYRDHKTNGFFIPPMEVFVANMRRHDFGGTCHTLNFHAMTLLRALGFDCYLVSLNDVHMGILVELAEYPGERMYLDFGSCAPFFKPVRFETDRENRSSFGVDTVHIAADTEDPGYYRYVRFRHGKMTDNEWRFHPDQKRSFDDFSPAIAKSNQPGEVFMNKLRCHIWQLDKRRNLSLLNNILTIRNADHGQTQHKLRSVSEMEQVVAEEFRLPKLPVREAIDILESLGVDIFAEAK